MEKEIGRYTSGEGVDSTFNYCKKLHVRGINAIFKINDIPH